MELLTAIVGGMIGFLGHHIILGSKIMSQLDDLAAAQQREATNITALAAGLQTLSNNLNKTLGDMKTAIDASKTSGNVPDLTGFVEAAQKNADAIGQAVSTLNAIQTTVETADPVAPVAEPPASSPAATAPESAPTGTGTETSTPATPQTEPTATGEVAATN